MLRALYTAATGMQAAIAATQANDSRLIDALPPYFSAMIR